MVASMQEESGSCDGHGSDRQKQRQKVLDFLFEEVGRIGDETFLDYPAASLLIPWERNGISCTAKEGRCLQGLL